MWKSATPGASCGAQTPWWWASEIPPLSIRVKLLRRVKKCGVLGTKVRSASVLSSVLSGVLFGVLSGVLSSVFSSVLFYVLSSVLSGVLSYVLSSVLWCSL